ncbi:MAG: hypothetical protein H6510_02860 [Acidobacteria bacterium]|nr:hypothetical protein [Acidobacteriota bacterium]MCB9396737.1 hypothetical protein [Acidobacteriota bacterium]
MLRPKMGRSDGDPLWQAQESGWQYESQTGGSFALPSDWLQLVVAWLWEGVMLDLFRIEAAERKRNPIDGADLANLNLRERSSLLGPGYHEELALIFDGLCSGPEEMAHHRLKIDGRPRLAFEVSAFRLFMALSWRWFQHSGEGICSLQVARLGQVHGLVAEWARREDVDLHFEDLFAAALKLAAHNMAGMLEFKLEPEKVIWRLRPAAQANTARFLLAEPPHSPLTFFLAASPFPWIKPAWRSTDLLKLASNQGTTVLISESPTEEWDNFRHFALESNRSEPLCRLVDRLFQLARP